MDVYYKKEITYKFEGEEFKFDIANTLFSTFDLDHGTDILIRAITANDPKTILDIGCGYGPLGIMLAKKHPKSRVFMVDRDLLAVRYANMNVEKNGIENAVAQGGLGTDTVREMTFDLIVSNVPAKIGDEAIEKEFILDPYSLLNPGGEYWIVIVSGLNRLIPKIGEKHKLNIRFIRKRRGHTVYMLKKPAN